MGHRLYPIFAKFGDGPIPIRIRPTTAWTIKPEFLVDLEEGLPASNHAHFLRGVFEGGGNGRDSAGPRDRIVDPKLFRIFERNFPRGF